MWTKNTNFEVAVQVPLFISAPGYRNARTTSKLVELVDLFPTIVELAQLPSVPPCGEVTSSRVTQLCTEGESLVPLLSADTENQWNKGADQYHYTYWLKFDTETQGWDWGNKDFGQELYDLRTDIYENENLARNSDYQDIVMDLHSKLETGWKMQMPNSNSVSSLARMRTWERMCLMFTMIFLHYCIQSQKRDRRGSDQIDFSSYEQEGKELQKEGVSGCEVLGQAG